MSSGTSCYPPKSSRNEIPPRAAPPGPAARSPGRRVPSVTLPGWRNRRNGTSRWWARGPAGLTAALAAAAAGARTVVIERAEHPRYKTCGGGLIGTSLTVAARHIQVPARDRIHAITATLNGRREFTRRADAPLLAMVSREDFDDALRKAAADAGVTMRQRATVRGISEDGGLAWARLADGTSVRARVLVGADGSSGVSSRYVGVRFRQVDLGLELEIPVPPPVAARWRERVMLDWGPMPGSYGWVFPKGDVLTVGVIAARGQGERTRRLPARFHRPARAGGLSRRPGTRGISPTAGPTARRCAGGGCWSRATPRACSSPGPGKGSASRSAPGRWPGRPPRTRPPPRIPARLDQALDAYPAAIGQALVPEMDAGRRLLTAFSRHPGAFHTGLASPKGWHAFARFCRSELPFAALVERRPVGVALSLMSRF